MPLDVPGVRVYSTYMDAQTAAAIVYGPPVQLCPHPPRRLYSWFATDGTHCVCCCACGAVLTGGAK